MPTDYNQSIIANQWCHAIASSYKPVKLHLIDKREAILAGTLGPVHAVPSDMHSAIDFDLIWFDNFIFSNSEYNTNFSSASEVCSNGIKGAELAVVKWEDRKDKCIFSIMYQYT